MKTTQRFSILACILFVTLARAVPITFQVNLSVQGQIGHFNPATDTVIAAGTFDNWSTTGLVLTNSPANTNVFAGVYDDTTDAVGGTVQFKFIISSPSQALNWEGINNRTATLTATSLNLPVVYFNNLTNNPGSGVAVTYMVNMGVLGGMGTFVPGQDTVVVAGTFNNWSTTASPLTNSAAAPYIYSGTFKNATDAPGGQAQFKFVVDGGTWENINNRSITLASTSQTLPMVNFNNSDLGRLSAQRNGANVDIQWMGGPFIRLQSSSSLKNAVWSDVTFSQDQSGLSLARGSGSLFYRLVGP